MNAKNIIKLQNREIIGLAFDLLNKRCPARALNKDTQGSLRTCIPVYLLRLVFIINS